MRSTCGLLGCVLSVALTGCGSAEKAAPPPPAPLVRIAPPPSRQEAQRQLVVEAEAAKDSGEYEVALALFRQILARHPTATVAFVGMGEVYLLQNDYAKAEPVFARAARLEPRNFDAQYGHGLALQMLWRFVEAVRAYHRALSIRPDSVDANHQLATTYLQMDAPQSALIFAQKVVQLDPANGPGRANLGSIYQTIGRYRDAIIQYEAAVELMEPTAPLLMNLINSLAQQRRYIDVKNTAEYLVRLAPSADAYERLGWSHFRLGDYQGSIETYRKAVELDGSHWPALNGVGCNALNSWLLSNKRDTEAIREARQAFRRSLRVNRDQMKVIQLLSKYGV